MEFFLAGDLLGDVELAADLIGGVEQRHLMAAAGGGGGKASRRPAPITASFSVSPPWSTAFRFRGRRAG